MRSNRGAALITTLIMLAAIGIMLSAIIYITRQYAKTAEAVNYGDILRQSAYVAMLENEEILVEMTGIERLSEIKDSTQLGVPSSDLTWIQEKYPDPQIQYYAYSRGYVGYIPNEVSLFSSNGSYIYSLFAKTAKNNRDKGFIYHESFWLNPSIVSVRNMQKIQVKIPNINTITLSDNKLEDYAVAVQNFNQNITAEIKDKKIYISSSDRAGYYDLDGLCASQLRCDLTSGWIDNNGSWSWVIAGYSDRGIYLWFSNKNSSMSGILSPDVRIMLSRDNDRIVKDNKNDHHHHKYGHDNKDKDKVKQNSNNSGVLSSNLNIININSMSYVLYVEKIKEKTQLVMRDIEDGNLSNKSNSHVSSVGKDKFWITIVDTNSDLNADNILIFGDKGRFGVIDVTSSDFDNMRKKVTSDVTDLVQPLIVSPADMSGNEFWISAVSSSGVETYFSDNSDFTDIHKIWQKEIDNVSRSLIYGGLLFIQNNNNDVLVLQMNNGQEFAKFKNIGSDFSIKTDFESKIISLISTSRKVNISNRKILFMREGLKQVVLP
jgi:hypothetical protein